MSLHRQGTGCQSRCLQFDSGAVMPAALGMMFLQATEAFFTGNPAVEQR
jgi:hypothetical protein